MKSVHAEQIKEVQHGHSNILSKLEVELRHKLSQDQHEMSRKYYESIELTKGHVAEIELLKHQIKNLEDQVKYYQTKHITTTQHSTYIPKAYVPTTVHVPLIEHKEYKPTHHFDIDSYRARSNTDILNHEKVSTYNAAHMTTDLIHKPSPIIEYTTTYTPNIAAAANFTKTEVKSEYHLPLTKPHSFGQMKADLDVKSQLSAHHDLTNYSEYSVTSSPHKVVGGTYIAKWT